MNTDTKYYPQDDAYVRPNDAGLASTPEAVGHRIARLLDSLDTEVNRYIVQGPIDMSSGSSASPS